MKPIPPVLKKILDEALVSPPYGNLYGVRIGSKQTLPKIKAYEDEKEQDTLTIPYLSTGQVLPTTPPDEIQPPSGGKPPEGPPKSGRAAYRRADVKSAAPQTKPSVPGLIRYNQNIRYYPDIDGFQSSELRNLVRAMNIGKGESTPPKIPIQPPLNPKSISNPALAFGIGSAAAYWPFTKSYDLSKEYLFKGTPEPIAHYGSFAAAIPPAELAARAAVTGVPTAVNAMRGGAALGTALESGLAATKAATGAALRNPTTWALGAYMATLPYAIEQEVKQGTIAAKQLQQYENTKKATKEMLSQMGIKEEPSWWDNLRDAFAKQSIVQRKGPLSARPEFGF